jgi:hypothetical protein
LYRDTCKGCESWKCPQPPCTCQGTGVKLTSKDGDIIGVCETDP